MDFIDLKTQYRRLKPVGRRAHRAGARARPVRHGARGRRARAAARRATCGAKHCIGVVERHGRAADRADGARHRSGRRGRSRCRSRSSRPAEMIALIGAQAGLRRHRPRTYNMDPAKLEAAITPRTKAIMPVSLYGQCAGLRRDQRDRLPPRAAGDRGRGAELRRDLQGPALGRA